jgi:serine/threonine protein phosphatase PrpC
VAIESADVSLTGDREDNQDRTAIVVADGAALLVVMDGMGGHAHGARAAETGCKALVELFRAEQKPLFDPLGFLHLALGRAHAAIVAIGAKFPLDARPRATCAICLVQRGEAWWAHVGDSRVYHLRGGAVVARTRDHSHVEQLVREGSIREEDVSTHPMRNFVECCLGGEPVLPEMSLSMRHPLEDGDVLMACTDGVWSNLKDPEIAAMLKPGASANGSTKPALQKLVELAVATSAPHSDNASAASLVWRH